MCFELKCRLCIGLGCPPKPQLPSTCSHSKPGVRVTWSAKEMPLKVPSTPCAPPTGACAQQVSRKKGSLVSPSWGWKPDRAVGQFAISPLALGSKAHIALLFICVIEICFKSLFAKMELGRGWSRLTGWSSPASSSPCSVSIPKGRVWKQSQQRTCLHLRTHGCSGVFGRSWAILGGVG